jgi:GTP:adenosylcobinamide-phosphate guanylyltransferase
MKLGVIILGGGPEKATWLARGKKMVDIVLEAVHGLNPEKIVLIGRRIWLDDKPVSENVVKMRCLGTLLENLKAALKSLHTDKVLIITSDLPLITTEDLKQFVTTAYLKEAEIVYSICDKQTCELIAPGVKRTCVTLSDGTFTGGNVFMVNDRKALNEHFELVEKVYDMRKSPLKLASLLGAKVIFSLLFSRIFGKCSLSAKDLAKIASKSFGFPVEAQFAMGSLGCDIDDYGQLTEFNKTET